MTQESIGNDLLAALDVAVLEEESARGLRLVGTVPEWFRRFRPDAASAPESAGDALDSPFLENFLIDARSFWMSGGAGRLRSGAWTEAGPLGTEFHLEASAVSVGARRFLLLENQSVAHEERQAVLQKARSHNLRRRERKRTEEPGRR